MFWVTSKDVDDFRCTPRHIVRPFLTIFCINAPYQYTPLLNLRPFIFSLTPFGWMRSITPTPYFLWDSHFLFTCFNYAHFLGIQLWRETRSWFTTWIFFFNTVLLTAEGSLCWYAIRFTAVSPDLRKLSVFRKTFDNVAHCFMSHSWRLVCTLEFEYYFFSLCEVVDDLLFPPVKFCLEYKYLKQY